MAAPQRVGKAVRPRASEGNLRRGEITTPNDHDKEPSKMASNPNRLEPFTVSSTPVSIATPATPRPSPIALTPLTFFHPTLHASTKINIGSVAISKSASPDPTYCSAQC